MKHLQEFVSTVRMPLTIAVIMLACCVMLATFNHTPTQSSHLATVTTSNTQYSYNTWYSLHGNKPFPPKCTVTYKSFGVKAIETSVMFCVETQAPPTIDQWIAYTSWLAWNECNAYENVYYCKALMQ